MRRSQITKNAGAVTHTQSQHPPVMQGETPSIPHFKPHVSAKWSDVPSVVSPHAADHNNEPKHELRSHPSLPVSKAQPCRKNIGARHEDDIDSQELSRHSQSRMKHRHRVVRLMKHSGKPWTHLSAKRRPHH